MIRKLDDAARELPLLVERLAQGEEIIITKNGLPIARLTSVIGEKTETPPDRQKWVAELADNAQLAVTEPGIRSTPQAYWDETRQERL